MGRISQTAYRSWLLFRSSICLSTHVRLIRTMSVDSIGRTSDSHSLQTVPERLIFHIRSSFGGNLVHSLHIFPVHCGKVWHRVHSGTIPELTANLEPISLHSPNMQLTRVLCMIRRTKCMEQRVLWFLTSMNNAAAWSAATWPFHGSDRTCASLATIRMGYARSVDILWFNATNLYISERNNVRDGNDRASLNSPGNDWMWA